jgi:uncharacterized protein (TIGR03790 family)
MTSAATAGTRLLAALLFAAHAFLFVRASSPTPQASSVSATAQLVSVAGNQPPVAPDRVLVVINAANEEGRTGADYYMGKRRIPYRNLLRIVCPDTVEWKRSEYHAALEIPVRERVLSDAKIDYIVLMKGIPFRFSDEGVEGGYSTDSVLATCLLPGPPTQKITNPYFRKNARFSRKETSILLVTRLDGQSLTDIKQMVDSAVAARPVSRSFAGFISRQNESRR